MVHLRHVSVINGTVSWLLVKCMQLWWAGDREKSEERQEGEGGLLT